MDTRYEICGRDRTMLAAARKKNKITLFSGITILLFSFIFIKTQRIPNLAGVSGFFSGMYKSVQQFFLKIRVLNYFVSAGDGGSAVGLDNFFYHLLGFPKKPTVFSNRSIVLSCWIIPIGFSYYLLSLIGYLVDVYWRKEKSEKNYFKLLLFTLYFPKILQGPISKHRTLARQLNEGHEFSYINLKYGLQLMLWGYAKKLIIADRLAIPVNQIFTNYSQYKGLLLFFGAVLYSLQIYTDFSGGIDIARGYSQIIGIDLDINFNHPYFSKSVEEFWRRWHITLGNWMKDYVFYPLSLSKTFTILSRSSRKFLGQKIGKKLPSIFAMFIVYILVGLWHGPEMKYLVYGLYNGIIIVSSLLLAEKYNVLLKFLKIDQNSFSWKLFRITRTFFLITFGRYFSRGIDFSASIQMIKLTCKNWNIISFPVDGTLLNIGLKISDWFVLIFALIILFIVDYYQEKGVRIRETISRQPIVFRWLLYYAIIFAILIFGVYGPGFDAANFIYGNF